MRGIKQNGTEKLVSSWVLKIKHLEKFKKANLKINNKNGNDRSLVLKRSENGLSLDFLAMNTQMKCFEVMITWRSLAFSRML